MDFLEINGRTVIPGKAREFQAWVRANSSTLARLVAEQGYQLVGIYFSMFGSEKDSGDCKTIWRFDSYGALDRIAAAPSKSPELARLLDELDSFFDVRIGADWSMELLKSVSDAAARSDHPER